jgi:hypothetical protein
MARQTDRIQSGILGDINPVPSAKDPMKGPSGAADSENEQAIEGGLRHDHLEHSGEVGGTRNYRQGTGAVGGDVGNRPE